MAGNQSPFLPWWDVGASGSGSGGGQSQQLLGLGGDAEPSITDLQDANLDGWLW